MAIKVRDPVHNFIRLDEVEIKLLNTPVFQRLRRISQLAMANLVYPGAVHTRFDHSLGVTHIAGLMSDALDLGPDESRLVRITALLHDIGHGPFSHVSENSLERFADRSTLAKEQKKEKIHEIISARIIETNQDIIHSIGKSMCTDVVKLLTTGHGLPALRSIVSGPLDSDKQDYLLRDSFFCGVKYGVFDIHQLHRSLTLGGPDNEKELMIKRDGIHAIEQYVLAKYYLTTNVYRHKVRLITDQMITRAIQLGIEKDQVGELIQLYAFDNSDKFIERYLAFDDATFMHTFCMNAKKKGRCSELLERLRQRRLLKRVFDIRVNDNDLEPNVKDGLRKLLEEKNELRTELEANIAGAIEKIIKEEIDKDYVILHSFSIRSVREMSRNDEAGILVLKDQDPIPFETESTLFCSINESYADEYVEVYAPVLWDSETNKNIVRRKLKKPILNIINEMCSSALKG
jgi:hypothetical protein